MPDSVDSVMAETIATIPTAEERALWRLYLCHVVTSRKQAHAAKQIASKLLGLDPARMPADEVAHWSAAYNEADLIMRQVSRIVNVFDAPESQLALIGDHDA